MAKYAVFGVRASDLEEARARVEKVTGLEAEARESSNLGGDYYLFAGKNDEEVRVLRNRDLHDDEPVVENADEWEFALTIEDPTGESEISGSLESASEHFEKLSEETY
jgi:hypothetical protein